MKEESAERQRLLEARARLGPPRAWDPRVPPLPWGQPAFSERMLREHLAQEHDRASRRAPIIAAQVAWMAGQLLPRSTVLDAACGPGLHALGLAARDYEVVGLDIAPAVIRHAREEAVRRAVPASFVQGDLHALALSTPFDAIFLLYGHFHTLPPTQAADILCRFRSHLRPGGRLFLELRAPDHWDRRTYHAAWRGEGDMFDDGPYLALYDHAWDEAAQAEVERYHIAQADGTLSVYNLTERSVDEAEWCALLCAAALRPVATHRDWPSESAAAWLMVEATG